MKSHVCLFVCWLGWVTVAAGPTPKSQWLNQKEADFSFTLIQLRVWWTSKWDLGTEAVHLAIVPSPRAFKSSIESPADEGTEDVEEHGGCTYGFCHRSLGQSSHLVPPHHRGDWEMLFCCAPRKRRKGD